MADLKRANRGFTLIELIAVVVILAVLAGVALPKYFDYTTRAKESACKGALGGVRAGIANFYANAAIEDGAAEYPTYDELTTTGEVMQEALPENPYNGSNEVRNADGEWRERNPPVRGDQGWAYDEETGKFWANSDVDDENRW